MREIGTAEAERLAGCRLDRRRKYATTEDGKPCDVSGATVFSLVKWTEECSGCDSAGCDECGYTGKRRQIFWSPLLPKLNHQEDTPDAAR